MVGATLCSRAATLAAALLALSFAQPARAACEDILPGAGVASRATRPVSPDDLIRLRDIGQPDGSVFSPPGPLALSPDGRRLAFIITRADPTTNRQCRALVAIDLAGPPRPVILDTGGEPITNLAAPRGYLLGSGFPTLVTPVWSPDGRWLAYPRRDHGITQVWRAAADGSGAAVITRLRHDAKAVAWTSDNRIVLATTPRADAYERALDAEGRRGWLFDARVVPNVAARPRQAASLPRAAFRVDTATGTLTPAAPAERALVPLQDSFGPPAAVSPDGRRAWTERRGASPLSPLRVMVQAASGAATRCPERVCDGTIMGVWWTPDGQLVFLRREGWADSEMHLYRWAPGAETARRILRTEEVLHGCLLATGELVCTSERSAVPRRIVAIALATGRSRLVFDPNPEFASLRTGEVRRLRWRNNRGLAAWGDLVLPPDYRPGQARLPMIVVQYRSYGFLRGGTGDEVPIFALAARGFAVLSTERPTFVAQGAPNVRSYDDVNAINTKDWAERRSLASSLETGVGMVVASGIADPARIGITGLSDGSTTARFALVNTQLFAAASLSTCCMDTRTPMTSGGTGLADFFRKMGYPPASMEDMAFWRSNSIALNAARIRTPLLLQLADDEYSFAFETFTALREHNQPVEMYVFPDEHHIKWQPAHRAAVYERNIDWFDYWLRDRRDPAPEKTAQYARWDLMRKRPDDGPASAPVTPPRSTP